MQMSVRENKMIIVLSPQLTSCESVNLTFVYNILYVSSWKRSFLIFIFQIMGFYSTVQLWSKTILCKIEIKSLTKIYFFKVTRHHLTHTLAEENGYPLIKCITD